jgi:hypothetical protein
LIPRIPKPLLNGERLDSGGDSKNLFLKAEFDITSIVAGITGKSQGKIFIYFLAFP